MRFRKFQAVFVLFAIGCDTREPMGNSPRTNLLLDTFVDGARFGMSFDSMSDYGTIIEQDVDRSGSSLNVSLPSDTTGFSGLRALGQSGVAVAGSQVKVYRFIFYSTPESAALAATIAERHARTIFEKPGRPGCTGYAPSLYNAARVWEEKGGGGVVLSFAAHSPQSADIAITRLVVFPPGVYARDAVANLRMVEC